MKKEQYEMLRGLNPSLTQISVTDLADRSDRTLLWGYTCDRESWHLYLKDGKFHFVWYTFCGDNDISKKNLLASYVKDTLELTKDYILPDKRVYPEASDFEFCKLLQELGLEPTYTVFNEERLDAQYYGKLLPEALVAEESI